MPRDIAKNAKGSQKWELQDCAVCAIRLDLFYFSSRYYSMMIIYDIVQYNRSIMINYEIYQNTNNIPSFDEENKTNF